MRKAGGIIALISGVFGILAALFTLVAGGFAGAVEAQGAQTVVGLGWGGVFFSFLTIIFGSICIGAKTKIPGILLIINSILGAILGGTFVAIFMLLSLVGGILALFGAKAKQSEKEEASKQDIASVEKKKSLLWLWILLGVLAVILLLGIIGSKSSEQDVVASDIKEEVLKATEDKPRSFAVNKKRSSRTANINDLIEVGPFELVVSSVNMRQFVGDAYFGSAPSEGAIYLVVDWKYKNVSNAPVGAFSFPSLKLMDFNNATYSFDAGASGSLATEGHTDSKIISDLNPGITSRDSKVFEVSEEYLKKGIWKVVIEVSGERIEIPFSVEVDGKVVSRAGVDQEELMREREEARQEALRIAEEARQEALRIAEEKRRQEEARIKAEEERKKKLREDFLLSIKEYPIYGLQWNPLLWALSESSQETGDRHTPIEMGDKILDFNSLLNIFEKANLEIISVSYPEYNSQERIDAPVVVNIGGEGQFVFKIGQTDQGVNVWLIDDAKQVKLIKKLIKDGVVGSE
jgi:hypothetical protein